MHDIEIELDVPVPMRDGTVLRADVYRPPGDGPFPVLVSRTPYGKATLRDTVMDFKPIVGAGYVIIQQDSRGCFASEGTWDPFVHEGRDGYDTIEWAAALPYSNGKVGMFGGSYLGNTQWSAAIAGPPHLAAISPDITWSDPEDGVTFRGGAIELGFHTFWALAQALMQYGRLGLPVEDMWSKTLATIADVDSLATHGYWGLPSGALPAIVATDQIDFGLARALVDRRSTHDFRVVGRYDELELPSLNLAGWFDVFSQGALDNYMGMRSRGRTARLVVGSWAHTTLYFAWTASQVGETNFGIGSTLPGGQPITDIHREWFDHWLKGQPATAAHELGVLIFVMGVNEWRAEPDWPLARAQDTPLYLADDASLGWSPPGVESAGSTFVYDPADPVVTRGGSILMTNDFPAGPFDQRVAEARDDVLVFTTAPLDTDLEITGRIRATLFASTDGPSTDWVVRLCEVDEHDVSRNIVDGIRRVHTDAGRVDEVEIDLWSTSIVIRAGHRLRVQVTSSNFPRWDRNLNTGEPEATGTTIRVARQRIFHDRNRPSRIVLPVVSD